MARNNTFPTDSERELRDRVGDDSTATFEEDPKFIDSNPGAGGSSENIPEQRDEDDVEDDEEELDEEDDEDEFDDEEDDEEYEDDEDEDEDEDDDEDEYDDDDDDDDDEDVEDDEDEVGRRSLRIVARSVSGADLDDDAGDIAPGVNEDELDADDMDTDRVASLPQAA